MVRSTLPWCLVPRLLRLCLGLAVATALAIAPASAQQLVTPSAGDYRLNPGDIIEISVWKEPELQREVLLLVCVEELAYREAAEVLEVPIGTIMSRLARARKQLAATLGINRDQERSDTKRDANA